MRALVVFILFLNLFLSFGCVTKEEKGTLVEFSFIPFYKGKLVLERIPIEGEDFLVIDSAELNYDTDRLQFLIPEGEERVYQLRIQQAQKQLYFINDVSKIVILPSSPDLKRYRFGNAGINNTLRIFMEGQDSLHERIAFLERQIKTQESPGMTSSHQQEMESLQKRVTDKYKAFADTTTSAGAFLMTYGRIHFDRDFSSHKSMIQRAASRFPDHKGIQQLHRETLDYISIYEEELEVGENIPELVLPDEFDRPVSLHSLQGKFILIDLWATWCPPCQSFIEPKRKLYQQFGKDRLQIVNIAVDAEKADWQRYAYSGTIPGIHLIDEKMWRGTAAYTFKFDSIPFNYLISPEGRVLEKAISVDSLFPVVSRWMLKGGL